MWLLHMEYTDGVEINHALNGREDRLPELPQFCVDGDSAETNTVYEYYGCHWHGYACQTSVTAITTNGDTLAVRYDLTISRL